MAEDEGARKGVLASVGKGVLFLLLAPVILAVILAFIVFELVFVFSGAGPIWEYFASRRDRANILSRKHLQEIDKDLTFISVRGHQLAVRVTRPPPGIKARFCPVVLPNGMAATMAMLGRMQENLRDEGFTVVSYDRYGCGFSEPNVEGVPPTVEETIADMDEVMSMALPEKEGSCKWIIVGSSMGSIIAQSYMSRHPDKVAGFLNLDGLPYPFFKQRKLFEKFGKIYWLEAHIVWTGLLRFFIVLGGSSVFRQHFAGECYKADLLVAQACERNFFWNVYCEMKLMIDCAQDSHEAWGAQSVANLDEEDLVALQHAPPSRSGDQDKTNGLWVEDAAQEETEEVTALQTRALAIIEKLAERGAESTLGTLWQRIIVRVMAARSYPYPKMFYTQAMQDSAAAEHVMHQYLALDGKRDVFPRRDHSSMFRAYTTSVAHVCDIDNILTYTRPASPAALNAFATAGADSAAETGISEAGATTGAAAGGDGAEQPGRRRRRQGRAEAQLPAIEDGAQASEPAEPGAAPGTEVGQPSDAAPASVEATPQGGRRRRGQDRRAGETSPMARSSPEGGGGGGGNCRLLQMQMQRR